MRWTKTDEFDESLDVELEIDDDFATDSNSLFDATAPRPQRAAEKYAMHLRRAAARRRIEQLAEDMELLARLRNPYDDF